MNIAAPGPTLLHVATSAAELRARGLDLREGARLNGVVLAVSGDRAVVDLGGTSVVARTTIPLREGQSFTVTVAESTADLVVLRVLPQDSGAALAAIVGSAVSRAVRADAERVAPTLAALLQSAGVAPTPEALVAADALVRFGVPVQASNVEFVVRRLSTSEGSPLELAHALAAARALDTLPEEQLIALLRLATPGPTSGSLATRVAAVEEAVAALGPVVEPPALDARVAAAASALADALGQLSADATPPVAAHVSAALAAADLPLSVIDEFGRVSQAAREVLRAPANVELAPAVASNAAGAAAALEDGLTTVAESVPGATLAPQPAAGAARLAEQLLTHLTVLSDLISSESPPAAPIDNTLAALRNSLAPYLPLDNQAPPSAVRELALRLDALSERAMSAAADEPQGSAEPARALVQLALERLAANIPGQAPDRLQVLLGVVQRAQAELGAVSGFESPPTRALVHELAWAEETLTAPQAQQDLRTTVNDVAQRLREVLGLYEGASQTRRADLLTLVVGRALLDVADTAAAAVADQLAVVRQIVAEVRGLSPLPPLTEAPAPAPVTVPAALRAAGVATAPDAMAAINELLVVVGSRVREAVDAIRLALSASSAEPAVAAEQSPSSPVTERLVALLAAARQLMAAPSSPADLPESVALPAADAAAALRDVVAGDMGRLVAALARLVARPEASSEGVAREVAAAVQSQATSTEARLLGPGAASVREADPRAAAARLARSVDQWVPVATLDREVTGGDLPARLAQLGAAARSLATGFEAVQVGNAAAVRQGAPLVAYVQVPVAVDGEIRLAELKVLRDSRKARTDLDAENLTVGIRLDTKTLGVVVAVLRAPDGALDVRFTLERPDYQRAVERGVPQLREALTEAGFQGAKVATEVRTAPSEEFNRLATPGPEGSSLSVLA